MTDDELEIPSIEPVAEGLPRPRWSVMIPTYNAERTIGETLRSVLAQAQSQDDMQICVVDNISTDQTLTVVERTVAGSGMRDRVEIHTNPSNLGMVGNFNACLRLSRGELVHLLHADDFIQPGFYAAIEGRMRQHPEAEICAARVFAIDAHGELEYVTNRLARTGELTVYDAAYENHLYPPGVVVRRAGYERVGGYSNVISYLPDWEMWTRLLEHCPGTFINEPLASYRQTPGNATDYFSRTANDLRDMMRFGHVLERRVPGFSRDHWRMRIRRHAEWGMNKWRCAGDETAFRANQEIWQRLASAEEKLCHRLTLGKEFVTGVAKKFALRPERARNFAKLPSRNASTWTDFPAALVEKAIGTHSMARELGRRLERSIRRFVRRGRKKDAALNSAGRETQTPRAA
jgi:glycosyltransferase involved in cell wall biosynthesis